MNRQIVDSVEAANLGLIVSSAPLSGGCISEVVRLTLDSGDNLIAKHHSNPPPGLFHSEAEGLAALRECCCVRVPEVIGVSENLILLEDLDQGTPQGKSKSFWQELGTGLAGLHQSVREEFGFTSDNYCGATAQINQPTDSGFDFFAEQRILILGRSALDQKLLNKNDFTQLEFIANNLERWIPEQDPVLIHGDLWSGNVHTCADGKPALIDPASYWGWAEAELAMTELFGGFHAAFYESYSASSSIDKNWRERTALYNLYHLLNHLLLFGSSYYSSVKSTLERYAN